MIAATLITGGPWFEARSCGQWGIFLNMSSEWKSPLSFLQAWNKSEGYRWREKEKRDCKRGWCDYQGHWLKWRPKLSCEWLGFVLNSECSCLWLKCQRCVCVCESLFMWGVYPCLSSRWWILNCWKRNERTNMAQNILVVVERSGLMKSPKTILKELVWICSISIHYFLSSTNHKWRNCDECVGCSFLHNYNELGLKFWTEDTFLVVIHKKILSRICKIFFWTGSFQWIIWFGSNPGWMICSLVSDLILNALVVIVISSLEGKMFSE